MEHPGPASFASRLGCPAVMVIFLLFAPCALAGIAISESIDPVVAGSGNANLVYTVQADNLSATTLDISLFLPAGVDLNQVDQITPDSAILGDPQSGDFSWVLFEGVEFHTLSVTLTVDASASDGEQVIISVVEQSVSPGENPVPVEEITDIFVPPPALALGVTDNPDPVALGETLEYRLEITNTSNAQVELVEYEFLFPPEVSYLGRGIGSCFVSDAVLSCVGGSLSSGETLTVFIQVSVDSLPLPTDQGDYFLFAQARLVNSPVSASVITQVLVQAPEADLTLEIDDDPDPVQLGNVLEYQLLIANEGNGTASIVEYQFTFPPQASYLSGGIGNCIVTEAILNCVSDPLAPGQTRTVPIRVLVERLPPLDEMGRYFLDAFAEIVATRVSAFEATEVLAPASSGADLALNKLAPSSASVGDTFNYRLVVRNNDPSRTVVDITVADFLPTGVTPLASPDCSVSAGLEPAKTGTVVSCFIEALSPGAEQTLTLPVQVDACPDTLVNQVRVGYPPESQNPPGMDPNPANDSDSTVTVCTVLPPARTADLSIVKSDSSDPVSAGGLLGYTLQVINQGPDPAEAVLVRDRLPGGVSVVELPAGCIDEGFQISCRRSGLAAGAQLRYAFTVQLDDSVDGQLRNTATVSSDTRDPEPGNNQAIELTRVSAPAPSADLLVDKTVANSVAPGARFEYRITVMNAGVDNAEAVVLGDTLPGMLSLVNATASRGSCTNADTILCELGSLASGASASVILTVDLDPAARGEILNTATVSSTTPDPNPDNNQASARTVISLERETLPEAAVCSRYRAVLTESVAEPLGPAPPGLAFSREADMLVLVGVPEEAGDYTLPVRVDQPDSDSRQILFELHVASAALAIPPPTPVPGQRLPPAVVGNDYSFQLQARGGNPPYRWQSPGDLPPGLTLYPSGLLAGRPTQSGDFTLPVAVRDALDSNAALDLRLQVSAAGLTDQTPALPAGLVGRTYRAPALVDGASPPFACQVTDGALPPGLSLAADCGIQGVPATAGRYAFTLGIAHGELAPITSNRLLDIAAQTPIPIGEPPRLTPLPMTAVPVPAQCRPTVPPEAFIQQGTVDPFGNRYLVGSIQVQGQLDLLLRKIDPAGKLVWEQRFDSGGDDQGYAVAVTPDLHIVAAGLLNTGQRYQGLVLKYAFSGDQRWERRIGTGEVTAFYGMAADEQSLYLAGERYNGLNFDALLLALDTDGEVRWEAIRDSRDTETAYRVALLPCPADASAPCELLVAGFSGRDRRHGWLERHTRGGQRRDSTVLTGLPVESLLVETGDPVVAGAGDGGWRVRRLSPAFDTRWSATLPSGEALRAMAHDLEGNLYVAGRVDGIPGDRDGLLWLLSPAGTELDRLRFDEGEDEQLTAVMIGPAGRLSVAGQRHGALGNRVLLLEVNNGKRFLPPEF